MFPEAMPEYGLRTPNPGYSTLTTPSPTFDVLGSGAVNVDLSSSSWLRPAPAGPRRSRTAPPPFTFRPEIDVVPPVLVRIASGAGGRLSISA